MADAANEPLMRHETEDDPAIDVDLSDVSLLLEKNLRHPGLFVWLLTLSAGISGLLFGCKYASTLKMGGGADLDR
jgi:SP family myo-inositol transporter-like MFS transporter 13